MIPDKYLYISPRQASQTLITHILEAMEKEPERSFTIALSGGTTPAVLFEVWEREFAGIHAVGAPLFLLGGRALCAAYRCTKQLRSCRPPFVRQDKSAGFTLLPHSGRGCSR